MLDESHFIDLMLWFFAMPERIFARVEKISDLEIDTDDFVEISAVYNSGLRVNVHLDLFGRPHEKHIVVVGERGSIQCLFDPDQIRIGDAAEAKWTIESFVIERNDMFMAVAQEFLKLIDEEGLDPVCTILDGLKTLRLIEACRESQSTGREIKLSSPNDD